MASTTKPGITTSSGDYAKWFREALKDDDLAREIEEARELAPRDARAFIKNKIKERYTAPE